MSEDKVKDEKPEETKPEETKPEKPKPEKQKDQTPNLLKDPELNASEIRPTMIGQQRKKYDLENLYSKGFFAKRGKLGWRAEILCPVMIKLYHPTTMLDVGCGIGDFVKWLLDNGIDAYGLEGTANAIESSVIPADKLIIADLREPVTVPSAPFDVAMCIEVAEHIDEDYDEVFCDNLAGFSNTLFMTIAGPGQGGHGHINLKSQDYWTEKFERRGFQRNVHRENVAHQDLGPSRKNRWVRAIDHNLCIYERTV